jgi:hypothetical protein
LYACATFPAKKCFEEMKFGLIWVNPKESKTQRNQKNKETKKNKTKQKHVFQSLNMPRSK